MESQTYKRTVSADDSGFQYELKMTALAALRLYNQADEFYLANNFDAGEKFDDLVFSASMQGQWTTWFIQLKHKQKSSLLARKITLPSIIQETKANKNDYNLTKYFDSYKAICRKFHPGSKDVIFGRYFEGARFAIFTNSILGDDVMGKNLTRVQLNLLSTNMQNEVNLKFDAKKDAVLFNNIQEKALFADFLGKFCLCSNQASEDGVDEIINDEIKRAAPDLSNVEVNYVNGQIKDYIRKWYKTREYLTKENIRALLLKTSVESQTGKKNEVNIKLLPSFLKQVVDNLHKEPIMIYSSKAANVLLCEAALKQLDLLNEPNIYANLKQLDSNDFRVMLAETWEKNNDIRLIINLECDVVQIDLKGIGKFISQLSKINKNNFIIMLSTASNERSQKLAAEVAAKKRNFTCTLINMHEDAKVGLLDSMVSFQGYETSLSSIMPANKMFDQVFEMSTISDLLRGQLAHIGMQPIESISYYITRVLIRHCILPTVFESCRSGSVFAVSGISLDLAKQNFAQYTDAILTSTQVIGSSTNEAKIIVLEGDSFDKVAAKVDSVHWLEKHKNLWAWKRSKGNVADILQYSSHIWEFKPTDNIMKIQDKVVLVIAEPGMGKSTLLVHMAAETKRLNPHMWVVLVTLNDFTDRMANEDFLKNVAKNVKEIVKEAAGVTEGTSKFNARLFDHCYDVSGKMIILLDGFDEITPYYTTEGLAMVNVLQNSKIERVWITARPIMRDQLLKATNIIPYNIKAFTAKDQKDFLSKFWKEKIPNVAVEKLNTFIDSVLALVGSSFEDESDEFYGIPLQTRMLAETYERELALYHQSGELTLPSKVNRLELFEAFVNKKLDILNEKAKVVTTNAVSRNQALTWRKAQEARLMKLALLTMLNQEQCGSLLPPLLPFEILQLRDEVANGEEKTGIVISYKGEVPQFIHRTFAEYFVARFFENHLTENSQFLTSETYGSSSFNLVKYFLDRLLAKGCPLHEAILNQNLEEVQSLLNGQTVDINKVDKGGRSALHLAASQPDAEAVICSLLNAAIDTSKKDSVFKWTSMQFALQSKDISNIAPLVEQQHFSSFPRDVLPIEWKTFKKAVEGDYLHLFLGLLENGIISVLGIDVLPPQPWLDGEVLEGMTYLHLAAAHNATKILQYLLRNDTRDSKLWLLERVNGEGNTALLVAAARGHSQSVILLLQAGANILATTKSSKNIVDLAVENFDIELLAFILTKLKESQNIPLEPFLVGALTTLVGNNSAWSCAALKLLLVSYPQLASINSKKDVPLIVVAISKCNDFAVKLLCERGVDVNQQVKSSSLLHLAIKRFWLPTVTALLECPGVIVDSEDELGQTPLFVAAGEGFLDAVKSLVEKGANVRTEAKDGSNVSHASARNGNPSLISYFLNLGVDYRSLNSNGESGMSILSDAGQDVMVDFLRSIYESQAPNEVENVAAAVENLQIEPENVDEPDVAKVVKKRKKKSKAGLPNGNQPETSQNATTTQAPIVEANVYTLHDNQAGISQRPIIVQPPVPKAKNPKPPKKKNPPPSKKPPVQNIPAAGNDLLINLLRDLTSQLKVDPVDLASMFQKNATNKNQKPQKAKKPQGPNAQAPVNPSQVNTKQKNKKPKNQPKPGENILRGPPPLMQSFGLPNAAAQSANNISLNELRQGLNFFNPQVPPPPVVQSGPPGSNSKKEGKNKGKPPQNQLKQDGNNKLPHGQDQKGNKAKPPPNQQKQNVNNGPPQGPQPNANPPKAKPPQGSPQPKQGPNQNGPPKAKKESGKGPQPKANPGQNPPKQQQ